MVAIDIVSIVIWELYVSITNILLKRYELSPDEFQFGLIGWALLIEVPRVIMGFVVVQQANFLIHGSQ